MQNTLVNVTPDATTDRATINAAGEVISDTFLHPLKPTPLTACQAAIA